MSETNANQNENEFESLGELLHKTRIERGLELEQIVEETRVSMTNLKAMEKDDFDALPADAFARGLYAHYATALQLNPSEVVARFLMERHSRGSKGSHAAIIGSATTPGKQAKEVSSMAEPTGVSPLSSIGFFLLLLIIIAAAVCWHLSINPAAFLSAKLRGISQVQVVEQPATTKADETASEPAEGVKGSELTLSSSAEEHKVPAKAPKYLLEAQFTGSTTVTVIIDDIITKETTYAAGDSITWKADQRISLTLPADSGVQLILNDIPLPLPKSDGPTITIAIPEDLLD